MNLDYIVHTKQTKQKLAYYSHILDELQRFFSISFL